LLDVDCGVIETDKPVVSTKVPLVVEAVFAVTVVD
jgi:hypothetical protein